MVQRVFPQSDSLSDLRLNAHVHQERIGKPGQSHIERDHEEEPHFVHAVLVGQIVRVDGYDQSLKRKDQECVHYVDRSLTLCDQVLFSVVLDVRTDHHRVVVDSDIELIAFLDFSCLVIDQGKVLLFCVKFLR